MTPTRLIVLATIVLAVFAAGQYGMNHWTHWAAETKASVWVAVGTIALATITSLSVWESREILRQEDVRHQEAYAPIVTVDRHYSYASSIDGLYLRNTGLGPAIRLHIRYTGAAIGVESKVESKDGQNVMEERETGTEPFTVDDDVDAVIHAPGSRTIDLGRAVSAAVERVRGRAHRVGFVDMKVTYHDIFGNQYTTEYPAFTTEGSPPFKWTPPRIKPRRVLK